MVSPIIDKLMGDQYEIKFAIKTTNYILVYNFMTTAK